MAMFPNFFFYIVHHLTYLFNLSLATNVIPHVWKSAFVIPVFKGVTQLL